MEEKAVDRGLLTQAKSHAESTVRLLLESVLPEGWTLTVEP